MVRMGWTGWRGWPWRRREFNSVVVVRWDIELAFVDCLVGPSRSQGSLEGQHKNLLVDVTW